MMLNLVKYEWLRRWKFFLAGIVIFFAANLSVITNFRHEGNNPRTLTALLILLCIVLAVALFLDHIARLYRSLFSDEGYLDFTLPLRGYQFLGGKLLAVVLECTGVMVITGLTFYLDVWYFNRLGLTQVDFSALSYREWGNVLKAVLVLLSIYVAFLLMVYLSVTLAKTIFASLKYGKLVAFLCFLAISEIITRVAQQISYRLEGSYHLPEIIIKGSDVFLLVGVLIILFVTTSYLLDRKLNL